MSVKPVTYYQVQCDCCGDVCDDYGDFSAWSDPGDARDNMPEDWRWTDDGDFCEDCWTWPEDENDPVRKHEQHPEPGERS